MKKFLSLLLVLFLLLGCTGASAISISAEDFSKPLNYNVDDYKNAMDTMAVLGLGTTLSWSGEQQFSGLRAMTASASGMTETAILYNADGKVLGAFTYISSNAGSDTFEQEANEMGVSLGCVMLTNAYLNTNGDLNALSTIAASLEGHPFVLAFSEMLSADNILKLLTDGLLRVTAEADNTVLTAVLTLDQETYDSEFLWVIAANEMFN